MGSRSLELSGTGLAQLRAKSWPISFRVRLKIDPYRITFRCSATLEVDQLYVNLN
jgi:hypothetical protein